jgi:GTPase involved in cell partitioning and DNA repair
MENKLDEIKEYTRRVSDRNDVVYMNQLQWLKSKLIEEERDEEANKINKCIENEFNKLKNREL